MIFDLLKLKLIIAIVIIIIYIIIILLLLFYLPFIAAILITGNVNILLNKVFKLTSKRTLISSGEYDGKLSRSSPLE